MFVREYRMALARIITNLTKYSDSLAHDLRAKGFEVQTFAPGSSTSESVDLELNLKECSSGELAQLTADRLDKRHMCVFLPPEAMAGEVRSIDLFVLKAESAEPEHEVPIPEVIADEEQIPAALSDLLNTTPTYQAAPVIETPIYQAVPVVEAPAYQAAPVREKAGLLASLSHVSKYIVSRYVNLIQSFAKIRAFHSRSADVDDAAEELVPHGLVGQAFSDIPESNVTPPAEDMSAFRNEDREHEIQQNEEPAVSDLAAEESLSAASQTLPTLSPAMLFSKSEDSETPAPALERNIPVALDLAHDGQLFAEPFIPSVSTLDANTENSIADNVMSNLSNEPSQQLPKTNSPAPPRNIRVITIRSVRRDNRLWNAAILAAGCAVLALGVVSLPQQHIPAKLSETSADSAITKQANPDVTSSLVSDVDVEVAKPLHASGLSLAAARDRSRKTVPSKVRARNTGDDFVAKDTFVDYRYKHGSQPEAAQGQTGVKRVVVQN
jgi:hypothetical protein